MWFLPIIGICLIRDGTGRLLPNMNTRTSCISYTSNRFSAPVTHKNVGKRNFSAILIKLLGWDSNRLTNTAEHYNWHLPSQTNTSENLLLNPVYNTLLLICSTSYEHALAVSAIYVIVGFWIADDLMSLQYLI